MLPFSFRALEEQLTNTVATFAGVDNQAVDHGKHPGLDVLDNTEMHPSDCPAIDLGDQQLLVPALENSRESRRHVRHANVVTEVSGQPRDVVAVCWPCRSNQH